jgi:hypothetical protein
MSPDCFNLYWPEKDLLKVQIFGSVLTTLCALICVTLNDVPGSRMFSVSAKTTWVGPFLRCVKIAFLGDGTARVS